MDEFAAAMAASAAQQTPVTDAQIATSWVLFQTVFQAIDQPLIDAVNTILTALTEYLGGPLKAGVTLSLAAGALMVAIRPEVVPINWLFSNLTRAAIVVFVVANVANFNEYVGNLFLHILPNEIGNAIAGAMPGGQPIDGGAPLCGTRRTLRG